LEDPLEELQELRRRLSLLGALSLSLLLHLVIVLSTLWIPLTAPAAPEAIPEPEDDEISISFVERPEPEKTEAARDVPPAAEPVPVRPPRAETAAARSPEEPAGIPEEAPQGSALEPPPLPEAPAPSEPPETVAPEPGEGARSFDLRRALSEFDRSISRQAPIEDSAHAGKSAGGFVPDVSELPRTGFGVGELTFESGDYDWDEYGSQVYVAIWRAWHRRLWMTTDDFERWAHATGRWYLDDHTRVRFVIESSGDVTGIAEEAPSACGPLNASAVEALDEVILPPLPRDFPREREVVHARFIATGWIGDMKPHLGQLRRAGRF
jgi:hypothetical protein